MKTLQSIGILGGHESMLLKGVVLRTPLLLGAISLCLSACQGGNSGVVPRVAATAPNSTSTQVRVARMKTLSWPEFRFSDLRTGFNPHEKVLDARSVPALQLTWQAQLGSLVDYSSPAVVNGVVYIGSRDGRLWAYSANGCGQSLCSQPLWTSTSLGQIIDSPTVNGGLVYVGSQTSFSSNAGKLDVFSAAGCGSPRVRRFGRAWRARTRFCNHQPRLQAGAPSWARTTERSTSSRPLDAARARVRQFWTAATGGSIESTPTVEGSRVYVGSDDGNLYAFRARGCGASTCKPLWTGRLPAAALDSSPAISNHRIYIGSQHGVAVFDVAGCGGKVCQPLWQAANHNDFFNGSPAIFKGRVYIGDEDGLAVFAAKGCGGSGCQPLWFDFAGGAQAAVVSSPTVANGVVYAGRNTGEVLAWKAGPCGKTLCTNIWSGAVNEEIVSSSPTVVNGKLYIGSADESFPSNIQGRVDVFGLRSSDGLRLH